MAQVTQDPMIARSGGMTARERLQATLNHRPPDRPCMADVEAIAVEARRIAEETDYGVCLTLPGCGFGDIAAVAALSPQPVRTGADALWCSWYPIRMGISEEIVLGHGAIAAEHFKPLGFLRAIEEPQDLSRRNEGLGGLPREQWEGGDASTGLLETNREEEFNVTLIPRAPLTPPVSLRAWPAQATFRRASQDPNASNPPAMEAFCRLSWPPFLRSGADLSVHRWPPHWPKTEPDY